MDSTNFGDGVNKLFWSIISKKQIICNNQKPHYITTGSIMNLVNNNSIIFGTGFISKNGDLGGKNFRSNENKKYEIPYKVISVRGPLSRQKLLDFNIDCPTNYGDPLILLPCIYSKKTEIKDEVIGIIPHYIDKKNGNLIKLVNNLRNKGYRVNIIDIEVRNDYKKLLDNVNKCKYIISSSLHGVIVGIVYKKKTIYVEFSNKVIGNGFKFQDFFKSISIDYNNINTYDVNIMDNIINVNNDILCSLGKKLINLIPFINNDKKNELTKIYEEFYSN